jgi:hypothetical protein
MAGHEDLSGELLKQNGGTGAMPDVDRIMRHERWRVRCWAAATIVAWLLAAFYLFGPLWFYAMKIHPVMNEYFTSTQPVSPGAMEPRMRIVILLLNLLLYWPLTLTVAAACTTGFILASRRATLRQIQASLAEISAQVRQLAARG